MKGRCWKKIRSFYRLYDVLRYREFLIFLLENILCCVEYFFTCNNNLIVMKVKIILMHNETCYYERIIFSTVSLFLAALFSWSNSSKRDMLGVRFWRSILVAGKKMVVGCFYEKYLSRLPRWSSSRRRDC